MVAIDATTGGELWNVEVANMDLAYAFTLAPLAIKDKVLVGTSGGDRGIRGFIAALDADTGAEVWRFYTIPGPESPGMRPGCRARRTRPHTAIRRPGVTAAVRSG